MMKLTEFMGKWNNGAGWFSAKGGEIGASEVESAGGVARLAADLKLLSARDRLEATRAMDKDVRALLEAHQHPQATALLAALDKPSYWGLGGKDGVLKPNEVGDKERPMLLSRLTALTTEERKVFVAHLSNEVLLGPLGKEITRLYPELSWTAAELVSALNTTPERFRDRAITVSGHIQKESEQRGYSFYVRSPAGQRALREWADTVFVLAQSSDASGPTLRIHHQAWAPTDDFTYTHWSQPRQYLRGAQPPELKGFVTVTGTVNQADDGTWFLALPSKKLSDR